jgi:hypothetical protein
MYEEFGYADNQVKRMVSYYAPANRRTEPGFGPFRPYQDLTVAWSGDELSRIDRLDWSTGVAVSQPVYERPGPDFDLDAAEQRIHRELVRTIPATVDRLAVDGPAYCLALGYFAGEPLSVMLYLGLVEDRDDEHKDGFSEQRWAPAELGDDEPADLTAVADLERLVRQELKLLDSTTDDDSNPGAERARRLLCAVARELNGFDWPAVLPVTDDFIVYPSDLEVVDLQRNVAESVPAAKLALLRDRGRWA